MISFMAVMSLVEDFYIAPEKSPMVLQVDNEFLLNVFISIIGYELPCFVLFPIWIIIFRILIIPSSVGAMRIFME